MDSGMTPVAPSPDWWNLLACPDCRGPLVPRPQALACAPCATIFPIQGGIPSLLPARARGSVGEDLEQWRSGAIRPRVPWWLIKAAKSPDVHRSPKERRMLRKALSGFSAGAQVLDIGCGLLEHAGPRVLRLDLAPAPGVDVAGDAHALPFRDATLDGAVAVHLLEHVREPWTAAAEIERVVKPGGRVIAVVPFLEPYHRNPTDHARFCRDGVERLFPRCRTVQLDWANGPGAALAWILKEYLACIFPGSNHPVFYAGLRESLGWMLVPVAWTDVFFRGKTFAHKIAAGFYYEGIRDGAAGSAPSPSPGAGV